MVGNREVIDPRRSELGAVVPVNGSFGNNNRIEVAEKWDEQVSRIGETIAHEEAIETPHRGSSTQRRQG